MKTSSCLLLCVILALFTAPAFAKDEKKSPAPQAPATGKEVPPPGDAKQTPPFPAEPAQPGADFVETVKPTATDKVNVKLTELFGTEETPGSGSIGYSMGQQSQQVTLGKETGVYAMGLVFEGINLPNQIKKGIEKQLVIQLAIGVNRSKIAAQVPQFAAITLLSLEIPQLKRIYPFIVPNPADKNRKEMAFLLFTPPNSPAERSDEEKLKSTFFANTGVMSLDPRGGPQTLEVKRNGDRLKFTVRFMEADIDGGLATPFHADLGRLRGKIKFPLYWPSNNAARALVQKMARDSLEGGSIDRLNPPRGVAGK